MVSEAAVADTESGPAQMPLAPTTLEGTGLDLGFLVDLALKTVYADAQCSTTRAAERLCLPASLVEALLQHLYQEKLIEIRGEVSYMNHRYALLDRGWQRVNRLLDVSGYIGPAPVSLEAYSDMVWRQGRHRPPISPEALSAALSDLVLPETAMHTAGLVVSSRRSLFMYGESGNGKTSIAVALHDAQPGEIWVPYAIEVDGQVIKVFDQHNHIPSASAATDGQGTGGSSGGAHDRRWIQVKRPLVVVGGEMTIETMDLVYSNSVRYYEAPFQMKANGGTLVIDDFGRQRVTPLELLNRWIVPLEHEVDYLTLHTGKKIEVPFQSLLVFATNLDPKMLVDEAFLRRMGYRLYIGPPSQEQYAAIFRRAVEADGLEYDPQLLEVLLARYEAEGRPLRCCEPRDLLRRLNDICRYSARPPELTRELLELAWVSYFGRDRGGTV